MNASLIRSLLRVYPRSWRARYGEELADLIQEASTLGDRSKFGLVVDVLASGSAERLRSIGFLNNGISASAKIHGGIQQILWAWIIFVIGGIGVAKSSEYWSVAVPITSRLLPSVAFNVLVGGSIFVSSIGLLAALLASGRLIRFLRNGGWKKIRRQVLSATFLTLIAFTSLVSLSWWGHQLAFAQRNGTDLIYSVAFLIWVFLFISSLAAWAIAGATTIRELGFTDKLLTLQARSSFFVLAAMVVMAVATATWWAALAQRAPWFLAGTAAGSRGTILPINLLFAGVFMLAGVGLGSSGAIGIQRSRRSLQLS